MKNTFLFFLLTTTTMLLAGCSPDEDSHRIWQPDGDFSFALFNKPNFSRDTLGPFALLFYDDSTKSELKWSESLNIVIAPGDTSAVVWRPWSYVSIVELGQAIRTTKEGSVSSDTTTIIVL